ncbi:Rpn family recombination-promoting nuclease/putative transposase [Blautia obeum]|uniref:Rpn family recombination-promoting nuclease/putative transposase n=1 Tax=Blautia obeum TaxID=40520 RepID=A0A414J4Y9_9FIRM|nr:Rpn family recombination-promoting nuclease/putative transposase [Blautia obeum]RHA47571.1 Rpn family recombination-promoting nuclease/putative transposase [Blautia obeum]RHE39510.1 Rpn family recombination-promoting nuclease/putative transposase [Blautia obeum]
MTEKESRKLRQKQDDEILRGIDGEEEVEYGLTNDYMFRSVFQASEEALKGLLSALLYIPEEEILSCKICNPIILGDAIDEKTCILDIRVLLNNSKQINLEMQMGSVENWTDRSVFYLCKMYTDIKKGLDYTEAKSSIHIGIMMKSPIPEDAAFYNEYALKNRRTGYEFTGKIALHVLDLSYLEQVPEEERNSALYYWACVFKAKTWKEVLAMAEQSESIKKAVVTLRELSEDEKIRLQCEARERYQMDWQSSMRTNREKGREEGRKEIILALVQKGMSIEKIAQIVGIEEAKIRKWIDEK